MNHGQHSGRGEFPLPAKPVSIEDTRLDVFRSLRHEDRARQQSQFVVEGHLLVQRLVASRFPVESILVTDRKFEEFRQWIPRHVPVYVVPADEVHRLVGFRFHRGILGCGRRLPGPSLSEVAGREPSRLVVCPELQDPENLGSILRSAAALGATGVILGAACPDPFSRRVMRVSMGAALTMPLVRARVTDEVLVDLNVRHGHRLLAAVLDHRALPVSHVTRGARMAVVLGREDLGLPAATIALCDQCVTVPMCSVVDSLNVATAAAILLYELAR